EGLQGTALRIDRGFRVATLQRIFGVAHCLAGLAERFFGVLAGTIFLSTLAILAAAPQLIEHLFELLAQAFLVLAKIVEGPALAIARRGFRRPVATVGTALAALAESFVAQALLLLNHAAELVELARPRIAGLGAGLLAAAQAVEHRLHFVEKAPGGV